MEPLPNSKKRTIHIIEYSQATRKFNLLTKKGKQTQTAALNINIKTINKNQLLKMPILGPEQKNIIADYLIQKANFSTTRKLYGVQQTNYSQKSYKNILKYMLQFYQNSRFITKILQNQNMDFTNKIILLKFAQKIRQSAKNPHLHKNWKQKF